MSLAAVLAGPAFAQCAPEPTVANGVTTCRGIDADGLRVATFGTRVTVEPGATVRGAGGPAVAVRIVSGDGFGSPVSVSVAGLVDGGTDVGVSLIAQPIANNFNSQSLVLTVPTGGRVTGVNGVVVGRASPSIFTTTSAGIDNAGTIASTGGIALLSTDPANAGFASIVNRAGGSIGAIVGPVGALSNAGTIDGGSRSAIDWVNATGFFFGDLTNSGTIGALSTAATLANLPGFRVLTNSGTIENRGTGAAIATSSGLTITNAATGRIASAGTIAISAGDALQLTNTGMIAGDVVAGGASSFTASTINSTGGRITGSLRFGAAGDTLVGLYDGTRLTYGVAGTIDGGAGIDTVRARFTTNATVATPLALPTAFEQLSLSADAGVTATLASGFVAPGILLVGGAGTLVNAAALTGAGQILLTDFQAGGAPTVVNSGSIASTLNSAGTFAVQLSNLTRFENSGTIAATRDAVSLSASGPIVNRGTITGGGTALSAASTDFTNAAGGVIRSTGGIGLILSGSAFGAGQSNAGRIEGATAGVQLSTTLVNTGVITGLQTGVILSNNAVLDNRSGGSVSGGNVAITARSPNASFFNFNNMIANAGTITGTVALGDSRTTSTTGNRFLALAGGVLNGNLTLGQGDLLVTELTNAGSGAFAGITGTVTATNSLLRLRVRQDATATIPAPAGFASVGYELFGNPTLTLTGASGTRPLTLAGRGGVDLTADIAATTGPAIQSASLSVAPGETSTTNALTITSRGALSLTRTDTNSFPGAAVALSGGDSFTNAGTIVATDRAASAFSQFAAISGGSSSTPTGGTFVTNAGTITLDGAIGITGARTITNSGSILQQAGGRAATGIRMGTSVTTLTNSGTIDVAGVAVLADFATMTIDNSGRIASSGAAAITAASGFNLAITNAAGGMIAGRTNGVAISSGGGTVTNAGTITGTVDLGFATSGRSFTPGTYVADGGTIAGNLLFGRGQDMLVTFGALGVSGRIDGGEGFDTLVHARRASDTVTLGSVVVSGFERQGVRAVGAGTVVTIRADGTAAGDLALSGDGAIVNTATIAGKVFVENPATFTNGVFQPGPVLASFASQGIVTGGFDGRTRSFANGGTIGSATLDDTAVAVGSSDLLAFSNTGTILNDGSEAAVSLENYGGSAITAANTGRIMGRFEAYLQADSFVPATAPASISFANDGTVGSAGGQGGTVQLVVDRGATPGGAVTLANAGTIEATGQSGIAAGLGIGGFGGVAQDRLVVTNSGTIRANAGGVRGPYDPYAGAAVPSPIFFVSTYPATALALAGGSGQAQVTNTATGTIEATGGQSVALSVVSGGLDLTNAGTIRGGAGTVLTTDDRLAFAIGQSFLAGAIHSRGADDRIVNTGGIIGSVDLGAGADRIDNLGRIEGNVFLGAGNDIFLQRASATLLGTVDAGAGDDLFIVDATGGGAVNGDRFVNFERFSQVGQGAVAYSGTFRFDTVGVSGGTVSVAAGQTLASSGTITITGSGAVESVVNDGAIAGGVSLDGGSDRVVNRGTVGGAVLLGDGDDGFVEGAGSRVAGGVDGGAGTDTYTALLTGDRTGLNARTGFERLAVEGSGTLGLTLDQGYATVSLAGTGLTAQLNGFVIGGVTGSDGADRFAVDGDVASVALGAGDDVLAIGAARAASRYDGGAGADVLRFTATGPVTLAGSASGFEQVVLAGNTLTVTGTLGATSFDDGAQALTLASGGTLAGAIDLGGGNDAFRFAAGGTLAGTIAGGAGTDAVTVELAGDRTLAATTLTEFETLASEGRGTLTFTGTQVYDQVTAVTDLTVASGASLTARQVRFGAGDQRFTVAGGFAGSVDGGAGSDSLVVSGGSVAFTDIAGIEASAFAGGFSTISGTAALGTTEVSGGRLVGLAGSTITAAQIAVRSGATFGSAGTVNGTLTVAGTLSPGASPGTMTVNGNVALASGSLSLFELTPTAQDRLVVNGALSIASGATLQLAPSGALQPGVSYDLITASGGISGSFSTVLKPDSLFGFVVQRADRIQLLGQFLGNAGFSPQVSRSIDYANTVLVRQPANSPLFAALPALLGAGGASDAQAFARLTPEPYASATQAGVENALALVDAARGPGFAADRTSPGGFTFGQTVGSWYRLAADPAQGVAQARTTSYGFLGGVGYGDRGWSIGGYGGYLNSRQRIDTLGARNRVDGWVAGVQGRYETARFGFGASIAYNAGDADTRRALPGGAGATGRYALDSWVSDVSAHLTLDMGDWALRPRAGVTYVRTTRARAVEAGGPFALTVARDRHVAGFADAGVGFGRSQASDAALRPFVGVGLRYQIEGERADAVAGYAGGPLGLVALGASRAQAVGTVNAGLSYRLTAVLDLFSSLSAQTGRDDHREAVSTGLLLRF